MKIEFERYGLKKYRTLTGSLEFLGGLGQLIGIQYPLILIAASAGLALLMFLGFCVRLKIRDPLLRCLPALFFMLINFYILNRLRN